MLAEHLILAVLQDPSHLIIKFVFSINTLRYQLDVVVSYIPTPIAILTALLTRGRGSVFMAVENLQVGV